MLYLSAFIVIIIIGSLSQYKFGPDNPLEEVAELIIEKTLNIEDVDLSRDTPEKKLKKPASKKKDK